MAQKQLYRLNQDVNQHTIATHSDRRDFDFIVVGLGSMGAPTCYYLASKGYSVLGLEQFNITHENGSHAGQSRLIRMAYFEHPNYVPLLKRAYENWQTIAEESGQTLYYPTGILYSGKADDFLISGSQKSSKTHNLPLENLSRQQQEHRYPQFNLPDDHTTVFEYNAGFIEPERAILSYAGQSMIHGAELHTREKVINWSNNSDGIEVKTDKSAYTSKKLIITAGPWAPKLLPDLKSHLKITRQLVAWVKTINPESYSLNKFPCWGINKEGMPGLFYGFPILPADQFSGISGMKLGYHYPADEVDPDNDNNLVTKNEQAILTTFLEEFMPGSLDSFIEFKGCYYSYSPDEHFILDHYPDKDNVLIATGFSGHGFKFASVIGEIMADLAIDNKSSLPIDFLSVERLMK